MVDKELLIPIATVAGIFILEGIVPWFAGRRSRSRIMHAGPNLALGITNGILDKVLFGAITVQWVSWARMNNAGFLHLVSMPGWLKAVYAIVLFDLWMYCWHWMNHRVPWLWRLHRTHHTDTQMDTTTAMRFHPLEILLSSSVRLLVIPLLGIEFIHYALYKVMLSPFILFHHSNIGLPERVDTLLRWGIVSPNMHRVHHSQDRMETDSNYGSIFSCWDRLFGTYRERRDYKTIELGLSRWRGSLWQTFAGALITPFVTLRPSGAAEQVRDE